jgi:hypothetical protein
VTPLERFRERLVQRFLKLDEIVDLAHPVGPEWSAYIETGLALATLTHETTPTAPLLSTKELAKRMGLHERTILRRATKGQLTPAAGSKRAKGSRLRWAAP